ncbi:hypothetical protein [Porticoccus sp.]
MSEQRYEVVFRGDVVPGQAIVEVKQRLAELFAAEPARIDGMFSGRPVVVKRNLDRELAQRYQASMRKAGAVVDIRPAAETEATTAGSNEVNQEPPQLPDEQVDVAPVGADVLTPEYRRDFTPANIDTSYMSIAETGADILQDNEKQPVPDRQVDTSHLSLDDPE